MAGADLETVLARVTAAPRDLLALAASCADSSPALARSLAERAQHEADGDPEVHARAALFISRDVPAWHFRIVRDRLRNESYARALERQLEPGMRVLEIGTGSGLLAMLAVRAGAAEVVTCEANPTIAEAARAVIRANGLDSRITVVDRHSTDLDPVAHLGGGADLLVSEVFSNELLGENVLTVHEDAIGRLVKDTYKVIPSHGTVRVALARDERIDLARAEDAEGFNLRAFNRVAPRMYSVPGDDPRLSLRGEPHDLFRFNLASGGPFLPDRTEITTTATADGANGIAQWIALDMDEHERHENRPGTGRWSSWPALFHPLPSGMSPRAGEAVLLGGAHDGFAVTLWARPSP